MAKIRQRKPLYISLTPDEEIEFLKWQEFETEDEFLKLPFIEGLMKLHYYSNFSRVDELLMFNLKNGMFFVVGIIEGDTKFLQEFKEKE